MAWKKMNMLRRSGRFLARHKGLILACAVIACGCGLAAALHDRDASRYEATATVEMVGRGIEGMAWHEPAFTGMQAAIARSYPVIEQAARHLGFDAAADPSTDAWHQRIFAVKNKVAVIPDEKASRIHITALDANPKQARDLANAVMDAYRAAVMAAVFKKVEETRRILEEQRVRIHEKLTGAEEDLRRFREKENLFATDSLTSFILDQITDADAELVQANQTIEAFKQTLRQVEEGTGGPQPFVGDLRLPPAVTVDRALHDRLLAVLLEKDALLFLAPAKQAEITGLDQRERQIRSALAGKIREQMAVATSRAGGLRVSITQAEGKLTMLPQKRLAHARLERELRLQEKLFAFLDLHLQEAKDTAAVREEALLACTPAQEPATRMAAVSLMHILFGTLGGTILGIAAALLRENFTSALALIPEVEAAAAARVIGVIPRAGRRERRVLAQAGRRGGKDSSGYDRRGRLLPVHYQARGRQALCYRLLRANMEATAGRGQVMAAVIGSVVGDGGKAVAANLAIAFAQTGRGVLLIEGDLVAPVLGGWFGIDPAPGLREVFLGRYRWDEVVHTLADFMLGAMDVEQSLLVGGLDRLHLITAGNIATDWMKEVSRVPGRAQERPTDWMKEVSRVPGRAQERPDGETAPDGTVPTQAWQQLLAAVSDHYDVIIIDLPPFSAGAVAVIAAAGNAVVVHDPGKSGPESLAGTVSAVRTAGSRCLGVVVNGLSPWWNNYLDRIAIKQSHPDNPTPALISGQEASAGAVPFIVMPPRGLAGTLRPGAPLWFKVALLVATIVTIAAGLALAG